MRALVRPPSPLLADGLLTHIDRSPVDAGLARRQWDDYVAALSAEGWELIVVAPAPEHPDGVFIEDTMVVNGDRAVIARPGATERRGEVPAAESVIRELGYDVATISEPATLDGGDVLKIDGVAYLGVGGRSTPDAVAPLAEGLGMPVVPVPVRSVLHLKSGVTALPDGTVIGYEPLVDDIDRWPRFLAVPEPTGAHVVVLDGESVLMAASAPQTAALLRDRGLRVVEVDISEFEKLEGCVTCLSVRLR